MCDNQKPVVVIAMKYTLMARATAGRLQMTTLKDRAEVIVADSNDALASTFRNFGKRIVMVVTLIYFFPEFSFKVDEIKPILDQYDFNGLIVFSNPFGFDCKKWEQVGAIKVDDFVLTRYYRTIGELFEQEMNKPIVIVLAKDPSEIMCQTTCLKPYLQGKVELIVARSLEDLDQTFQEYGTRIAAILTSVRTTFLENRIDFIPDEVKEILDRYGYNGALVVGYLDLETRNHKWREIGAITVRAHRDSLREIVKLFDPTMAERMKL